MTSMHLLLATDGSPSALAAATWITEHWEPAAVRVTVIAVQHETPPPLLDAASVASPDTYQTLMSEAHERARHRADRALAETVQRLPGFSVETALVAGAPVDSIVAYIEQHPVDLAVMGRRGLGPLQSLVIGSVSLGVMQRVPVPVLICPPVRTPLRSPS